MDPFTIIATALVAGAAAGGKDAASAAVRDAYAMLRNRIHHVATDSDATAAIEANEADPGSNAAHLRDVLAERVPADDVQLQAAAAALLSQLPSDEAEKARIHVELRDAKGVQIGDHNTQHNLFG